ncbi:MAG: FecR domain-containing protein, partial [Rubripirellula sp.]
MSNEINQNELLRLCGKVRDQCISDAEFVRLEQMLRDDSGALQFYRRFMSLCSSMEQISDLQSAGGATDNAGNDSISDSDSDSGAFAWIDTMPRSELAKPTPSTIPAAAPVRINRKRWIAAGLGVVSTVAAAIALMLVSVGPSSSTERFASLVDSRQAVWIGENQPADGAMLASVDYTLASGAAQLRYDNGAILLIQAPAVFSIDAEKQATLRSGSLALTVPPTATGFRIQTPQGTVVDLGTRIGVMTDEEVGLEVHVFEGRAEAIQANATRGELLAAGQAAVLSPENK